MKVFLSSHVFEALLKNRERTHLYVCRSMRISPPTQGENLRSPQNVPRPAACLCTPARSRKSCTQVPSRATRTCLASFTQHNYLKVSPATGCVCTCPCFIPRPVCVNVCQGAHSLRDTGAVSSLGQRRATLLGASGNKRFLSFRHTPARWGAGPQARFAANF